MPSVMRSLLIAKTKDTELLYGHSILWELSGLDYVVNQWKKPSLGDISIYFKDLPTEDEIDAALENEAFDLAPGS